jgi:hypothetical protein
MFAFGSLLAVASLSVAQDMINHCPLKGTAGVEPYISRNKLKNRYIFPKQSEFDPSVTLPEMLKPGVDTGRFSPSKAGRITGYVYNVDFGGTEACNCTTKVKKYIDTHITLTADPQHTKGKDRLIVEVTPRIRAMMLKGTDMEGHTLTVSDWSTDSLKARFLHQWVEVEGWYFFDWEHTNAAQNTHKGKHNWRGTCSEIHPVTAIRIVNPPH